jgi:site-specific DNA-adenine methylase
MNYGIPYLGSKSGIAKNIIAMFPKAENFYDLFGGGFAITHAMLIHRPNDFKIFHFNEIRPGIPQLIKDAIAGRYSYENFKPEFVTRDDFFKNKESDIYKKIIWSFGNSGEAYLFSKEIEPYKKSMHNAVVFNEFDPLAVQVFGFDKFPSEYSIESRRIFLRRKIEYFRKTQIPKILHQFLNEKQLQQLQRLEQLQELQQLEQLKQLQELQQLERLERLKFYNSDYREIEIKSNSVIYCDIPYQSTAGYDNGSTFNREDFFCWAKKIKQPLFVSEYKIEESFLKQIYAQNKMVRLSSNVTGFNREKLYCNEFAFSQGC